MNKTNNKFSNLRLANNHQNHGNIGKYANNTSGFKGVSFCRSRGNWEAYINKYGTKKNLGRFDSPESAHAAYCDAAKIHFGAEFFRSE